MHLPCRAVSTCALSTRLAEAWRVEIRQQLRGEEGVFQPLPWAPDARNCSCSACHSSANLVPSRNQTRSCRTSSLCHHGLPGWLTDFKHKPCFCLVPLPGPPAKSGTASPEKARARPKRLCRAALQRTVASGRFRRVRPLCLVCGAFNVSWRRACGRALLRDPVLVTPRMEPWTDGAPLILKSELQPPVSSEDGALVPLILKIRTPTTPELRGWSLGWGAPDFKIRTPTTPELRGWSLGLMGRP